MEMDTRDKAARDRLAFARNQKFFRPKDEIHKSAKIGVHATIGKDGFGWIRLDDGTLEKFPHAGNVIIEKDVEVGNFTCIDRAAVGSTVIGEGTKIDNLVHIAHGVKIGKHCLIVAGAIIGGSVEIGDYSYIGIGAMVKNKVKIGKNVMVGMGAVVIADVPDNCTVVGNPAKLLVKDCEHDWILNAEGSFQSGIAYCDKCGKQTMSLPDKYRVK